MAAGDQARTALRLTFAYQGDSLRVADRRLVNMLVPRSDPVDGYQEQAGFWVELRDSAGTTIYRRVLHDPMPVYHEVHSAPGAPATRTPVGDREGVFEVVLPAPPPGSVVVLFSSSAPPSMAIGDFAQERARADGPRTATDAAREIARFDFNQVTPS